MTKVLGFQLNDNTLQLTVQVSDANEAMAVMARLLGASVPQGDAAPAAAEPAAKRQYTKRTPDAEPAPAAPAPAAAAPPAYVPPATPAPVAPPAAITPPAPAYVPPAPAPAYIPPAQPHVAPQLHVVPQQQTLHQPPAQPIAAQAPAPIPGALVGADGALIAATNFRQVMEWMYAHGFTDVDQIAVQCEAVRAQVPTLAKLTGELKQRVERAHAVIMTERRQAGGV